MALVKGKDVTTVAIAQGAGAATTDLVAAPAGGLRIFVIGLSVSLGGTAGTIQFQSGTGPTNLTGAQNFGVAGGMTIMAAADSSIIFATGKGEKLTIVTTGSGGNGWLTYYIAQHGGI